MKTAGALRDAHLRECPTELARMRYRYNLTVREVAEAVGYSYGMLSTFENGWSVPPPALQTKLAAFYEVEVGELFPRNRSVA